jgi:hypothetical protein
MDFLEKDSRHHSTADARGANTAAAESRLSDGDGRNLSRGQAARAQPLADLIDERLRSGRNNIAVL